MEIKQAFKIIRNFEYEMGESFTDQNETIVRDDHMMFWMLGKGYITGDQIETYANTKNLTELNNIIANSKYEDNFAVFHGGSHHELCHYKCMLILAEFICLVPTYIKRLENIVKEHDLHISTENDAALEKEYNLAKNTSIEEIRIMIEEGEDI